MRSSILPFKISTLIFLLLLFFSSQNIFAQSGWQSMFYNNVFFVTKFVKADSLNYFAFSSSSKNYLRSTNGGNNWISSPELTLDSNYAIYDWKFLNANTGWIVGTTATGDLRGVFFKTTNGGENWVKQIGPITYGYLSLCFTDINTGWIGSWGGAAYPSLIKTTNGGNNWSSVQIPQASTIDRVSFFNSDYGWILNTSGYLYKTTNSGNNWLIDSTFKYLYLLDVYAVSQNECWILARDGTPASRIYKTTNGGISWSLKLTTSNLFGKFSFINNQTFFAYVGNIVFRTTNGGNNWDSILVNSNYPVNPILPIDENTIIAGGGQNVTLPPNTHVNIIKTTNHGINWQQTFYNRNYNFSDISFKDFQNGLAIETNGIIIKTTNSGINWTKIYENPSITLNLIKYLNDTNVLVTASGGVILRTNDYGDNWTYVTARSTISKLYFLNEFTGYGLGGWEFIQKTTNGGLNWDSIPAPAAFGITQAPYSDICFINENTGWLPWGGNLVAGGHGVIYENKIRKTTNGGANWFTAYSSGSSTQFTRIKFFNENTGWTWVGNTVYQTIDGGSNWSVLNQNSAFTYNWLYMLNNTTGWMTGTSGISNAICKTTNGGLNWFLQFNEGKGYLNSVFIKDENNLWACGYNNGIYKTTNGGGVISAINPISSNIPEQFSLHQNYPNPFNPTTKINFDLKSSAFALLRVYDITGREVNTLVNEKLSAGSYSYDFNASELPSGVYFYQLQAEGFIETKKMILLK